MSLLVMLLRKCMLAASRAPPGKSRLVCAARSIKVRKKTGRIDRRTDGRQTVTLCLPLKAASVKSISVQRSIVRTHRYSLDCMRIAMSRSKIPPKVQFFFLANVILTFKFAICYRPSVCRMSVCDVGAPYSAG